MSSTFKKKVFRKAALFLLLWVAWILLAVNGFAEVSVNDGFDPSVNGPVSSIVLQPDGKIIIGGGFISVGGTARNYIARLSADGSLDTTFINPDANSNVSSIALQPDGKILVGGYFTSIGGTARNYIARLNADGTLDAAFNNPDANNYVSSIALQPDGKILIGGWFTTIGGTTRNYIARLNADGTLDAAFDPNFDPNANGRVSAIALQSDGKIIVGGEFTTIRGITRNYIARINADGTLDAAFDPDVSAAVFSIALQPDGKIIIGGGFISVGGTARNYIARINADGSLDTTFIPDANSSVLSIALQLDGKIIVGGYYTTIGGTTRNRIARLNMNGSLDATFNPNANSHIWSIVFQPDGKIIVGGYFTSIGSAASNYIARLNADSSLDTAFNPNANETASSIALQPDGKIIVGGYFTTIGGTTRNRIARLNMNGSLDVAFSQGVNDGGIDSIALQSDGRIIIGGWFTTIGGITRNRIARLNADGNLDAAFDPTANDEVYSIVLQSDGKIIIGGYFTSIGSTTRNCIARLDADGNLDATFDPNANSVVYSIALQPDGKIIIGGEFTTIRGTARKYIARLNTDSGLDTGFNPPDANNSVYSTALQPDGKIIIGGSFTTIGSTTRKYIARLNAEGSLDTDFNPPDANGSVSSIALQLDGKIIIGGSFTTIGSTTRNCIARLNADGSLDTTFNPNANGGVSSIALQPDGKIIIGGKFTIIGSTTRKYIARLSNDIPVLQSLSVSTDGTAVTWARSGSGPEIYDVVFEQSSDGGTWTSLGTAARISGGWQLTGLALPFYQNHYIRARGTTTGGEGNSSHGIVESVRLFYNSGLLTVTKAGTGFGTVTSSPPGIDCGSDCSEIYYNQGTSVTLTATPDAPSGSAFSGWSGACIGTGTCTINMDKVKTVTATFTDIMAPAGTITINGGAELTNSLSVVLAMTCSDVNDCAEVQFSNDNAVWSEPETFVSSKAWTLLSGDGTKTVYVRFKDVPGNWSSNHYSDTINLDTTPPTAIINGTPPNATNAISATLTVDPADVVVYKYKVDSGAYSPEIPVGTPINLINLTQGPHTVYVIGRDTVGNWQAEGSATTATWTVDTTPPTGEVNINNGALGTNSTTVTLTFMVSDAGSQVVQMCFRNENDANYSAWEPIASSKIWTLSEGTGVKTVYVKFRDAAGNESTPDSHPITVDTTSPVTTITSPASGAQVSSLSILQGTVTDAWLSSGINRVELQVTDGTNYLMANESWSSTPTYFTSNGGIVDSQWRHSIYQNIWSVGTTYTIRAKGFDHAGNSQEVTSTFTFVAPTQAYTELSVTPSSVSILQNGNLEVTGQLSRPGDSAEDLSNKEITLTITYKPDQGTPVVKAVINANTNADTSGHYLMTGIEKDGQNNFIFDQKGIYAIQASFAGSPSLMGAMAECFVVVGQVAGYAIIVQGKILPSEEGLASHNKTTNRIYNVLKQRGFIDDNNINNIKYFNYAYDPNHPETGIDALPTKAGIQSAIQTWAYDRLKVNPAPLYIIMVDHGTNGNFNLGDVTITPTDLADWLDNLEGGLKSDGYLSALAERRIVIIGSCYSGSFITQRLSKPATLGAPDRLIITSAAANEESYRGPDEPPEPGAQTGIRSGEYFMEEFFIRLGRGYSFKNSFEEAARKTREYTRKGGTSANSLNQYFDDAVQHPLMEDSGDGKGSNTLSAVLGQGDGHIVKNLWLGVGPTYDTNSDTNPAELLSVTETRHLSTLQTSTTLELWANRPPGAIREAWVEVRKPAVALSPGSAPQPILNLRKFFMTVDQTDDKKWARLVEDAGERIFYDSGKYEALYFVSDNATGKISPMKRSVVYKNFDGNSFPAAFSLRLPENDSTPKTSLVFRWYPSSDQHGVTYNLVIATDSAMTNVAYRREEIRAPVTYVDNTILVKDPTPENPVNMRLGLKDNTDYYWKVEAVDGYGAVTVSTDGNGNPQVWHFHTDNTNGYPGILTGIIYTDQNFAGITSAVVQATATSMPTVNTTSDQGQFALAASYQGEVTLTASAPGYYSTTISGVSVQPGETTKVYIPMTAKMLGDMNRDNVVSLDDAILALKVVSGVPLPPSVSINKEADVSGDNKIGLAEVIYIMQKISGLRQP